MLARKNKIKITAKKKNKRINYFKQKEISKIK